MSKREPWVLVLTLHTSMDIRDGYPGWGLPQISTLSVNKHYGFLASQGSVGLEITGHHNSSVILPQERRFSAQLSSWSSIAV